MQTVLDVEGFIAGLFLRRDRGIKLAGRNLFRAGGNEAKLAGGKIVFSRSHGRPEGATEDRAVLVEIAGAMFEIEHGAGLVVGELFEENGSLVVFVENARVHVAGKPGIETRERIGNPATNARCFFWVGLGESFQAFAQAHCIFMRDGEDADAALGAAGFTDKMMATAMHRVGERGVNNLY